MGSAVPEPGRTAPEGNETVTNAATVRAGGWALVTALFIGLAPQTASADGSPVDQNIMQMGGRFGKFMGSFMRELQSDPKKVPETVQPFFPAPREPPPPAARGEAPAVKEARPEKDERRQYVYVPYPTYDPWGADFWGNPSLQVDPWGMSSFAERDWARNRHFYGPGGPLGYGGYHPDGYGWGGYPGPDWRYGSDRYGSRWYGSDRLDHERYEPDPYGRHERDRYGADGYGIYRYGAESRPHAGESWSQRDRRHYRDPYEWDTPRWYDDRYREWRERRFEEDRWWR